MGHRFQDLLAALLVLLLIARASCIASIEAVGSKFFNSETGDQFYIRGVSYQVEEEADTLANPAQCKLDAALMKTLGVNTIRVYSVDNAQSHDDCMTIFANAGIYLLLGLDTSQAAIHQLNTVWTMELFSHFTRTLDAFSKYDNLLAVTVGNEIVHNAPSSDTAPYIKAAIRDVKAYRDGQGYRKIPVGYTSADISGDLRLDLQDYLVCGDTIANHADFYGLNRYSWCGNSTFTNSGYSDLYDESQDYPVPIFFSETGCDLVGKREFNDQKAILGFQMNDRWSGAIIYEWKEEANKYGIISYAFGTSSAVFTGTGTPAALTPTPISPDFYSLQSQWDTLTPTGTPSSDYKPTYTGVSCPQSSDSWSVAATATLPTIANLVITTKAAASSSIAQASASTPVIAAAAASPSVTPSSTNTSSGLSTAAKIAIGVVIPVVLLTLSLALFLLWRRRKSKSRAKEGADYGEVTQNNNGGGNITEFYKAGGSEADGNAVAQLHADDARQELGGRTIHQMGERDPEPVELEARSQSQMTRPLEPTGLGPSSPLRRFSFEGGGGA
ncbi:MAG: hypothetical protein Q9220_000990 [cf. Caloplaca sp. 1 TL-2023]